MQPTINPTTASKVVNALEAAYHLGMACHADHKIGQKFVGNALQIVEGRSGQVLRVEHDHKIRLNALLVQPTHRLQLGYQHRAPLCFLEKTHVLFKRWSGRDENRGLSLEHPVKLLEIAAIGEERKVLQALIHPAARIGISGVGIHPARHHRLLQHGVESLGVRPFIGFPAQ